MEVEMRFSRRAMVGYAVVLAAYGAAAPSPTRAESDDGVVHVRSAYPMTETISRLKADVAAKGIMFFTEIDQAKLAKAAGIDIKPSTLLIFGNPPLGTQFLASNPDAGLDWPVRVLVHENAKGEVSVVYSDFGWIARRYGITDRGAQFDMASSVIGSITSSIAAR
jgi:uncharacterized protein (DUF302 family)